VAPHDVVCEGTAWSAERNAGGDVARHALWTADRRNEW
jgi:hypothetical protein